MSSSSSYERARKLRSSFAMELLQPDFWVIGPM
jgi:hypothetical protein